MKLVLCHLPKDELPRYLSCYLKSDLNNGCKIREKKRRLRSKLVSAVEGTYRSQGVEASEVAIDNQVVRVHMERLSDRDILHMRASLLLKKRGRRPKRKLDEDGEVPSLRELCETIVQSLEPPLKKRRGRPRLHEPIYEPKSLKALCESVLNRDIPRRRGRKRKRTVLQSPQSLKELCKAVIESSKPRARRGRKKRRFSPPTLKELCKRALGQEDEPEEGVRKVQRREVARPQRRKKFNKKWLGFADVPKVMKAAFRGRLKRKARRDYDEDEDDVEIKSNVYVKKPERVKKARVRPLVKVFFDSDDSDTVTRHGPPLKTYKRNPKRNGNLVEPKLHAEKAYRLYLAEDVSATEKSQITMKFTDLLREIQKVALPSSEWKIKIILYNQQISQIVFSNKSSPERCVNVYRNSKYYDISFDKMIVILLGAPKLVDSLEDLNFLLKIVHSVKDNDPVLQYTQK